MIKHGRLFILPLLIIGMMFGIALVVGDNFLWTLSILSLCAFFQNMTFTAVSRSRNSGDPSYHRKCAYGSNGVWFITYFLILKEVWGVLEGGFATGWWRLLVVCVVYTLATAEGSVVMMKILLKTESGKRRVGAR